MGRAAGLRIAVFVNRLPPMQPDGSIRDGERFGGVQRACWSLTRALARRGHDVWVFASGRGGLDVGSWHVRLVPARGRIGQAPLAWGLFREPGRCLDGADVVLAYMGDAPAPQAAAWWARRWRAPLVTSYHGDPVHGFGSPARRLALGLSEGLLAPRVLRRSQAVLALSESAARSSRLLAALGEAVRVLPNGVDEPASPAADRAKTRRGHALAGDAPVVLFIGSLTPIKGVDVLLDAFAKVIVSHPAARLVVVGDGPHRPEYEDQARRLGLGDHARFLGFVSEADKADLLAAADVLVMPSRSEAFPLTLLEAGLAGLPAVASAIPALVGLLREGETGLLVPPEDSQALAHALRRVLDDTGLRTSLGRAALVWAKGFTWAAVAEQTEGVFAGLVTPR